MERYLILGVSSRAYFEQYNFSAGTHSYNLIASGILVVSDGDVAWFGYYYYNKLLQAASNVGSDIQVSVSGTTVTIKSSRAGHFTLFRG